MSAELKPCPFCGGVAEQQNYVVEAVVHCTSCYAVIRRVHARDVDSGIDESASAWNTRAPQWLPIESAPKDGTAVLATSSYMTGENGEPVAWAAAFHQERERWTAAWDGEPLNDVTHWQPLPALPEVQP